MGWLTPDECPLCSKRRERDEQEAWEKKKKKRLLDMANLPAEAAQWNFESAETEAMKLKRGEDLQRWRKAHYHCRTWPSSSKKGFYILGPTGTGKSVLGYCLVQAVIEEGKSAAIISVSEMFHEMRRTFAQDSRARDLVGLAEAVQVLVLDEIGAERPRGLLMDTLLRVIDQRISSGRPTHYTTNCKATELAKVFKDQHGRIVSRIVGSTHGLLLDGQDFRTMGCGESWFL